MELHKTPIKCSKNLRRGRGRRGNPWGRGGNYCLGVVMATIPGSQFDATAPGQPVNVVVTTTGTGLPPTVPGAFNLEVFVGALTSAPTTPAAGYQGLAVLTSSGLELDLISGAFAVTDNGSGNDTLSAFGSNETISGGGANVTLNLFGSNDV